MCAKCWVDRVVEAWEGDARNDNMWALCSGVDSHIAH